MKYSFRLFVSFGLLLGFFYPGICLSQGTKTTIAGTATASPLTTAITLYQEAIGEESHLYNGPEYVDYDRDYLLGHQYFRSNEESEGAVFYDGVLYPRVPMLYDIMLDEVVVEHPNSALTLSLVNEKVTYFTLREHTFIRLVKDSLSNSPIKTGFYDLLHDGPVQLLAKHIKTKQERVVDRGLTGQFEQVTRYYLRKDKKYYQVNSLKSVLKVLPDKKKELQKYARDRKLKFRKDRENSLLLVTREYDKLIGKSAPQAKF